jgi:hypothetical protein
LGHVFGACTIVTEPEGKVDHWSLPAEHNPLERHGVTREDSFNIG